MKGEGGEIKHRKHKPGGMNSGFSILAIMPPVRVLPRRAEMLQFKRATGKKTQQMITSSTGSNMRNTTHETHGLHMQLGALWTKWPEEEIHIALRPVPAHRSVWANGVSGLSPPSPYQVTCIASCHTGRQPLRHPARTR